MQCLIVAAGKGLRLRARGESKPLVEVAGKPLVQRVLENAALGGVKKFVIVTGYGADGLEGFIKDFAKGKPFLVKFIRNPEFEKPNGLSVLTARHALQDKFLLSMCDHLMDPEMIKKMAAADLSGAGAILGVDRNLDNPFVDLEDVTKVKTSGDVIQAIGKGLLAYDCFDTGLFLASSALLDAIEDSGRTDGDWSISGGMLKLSEHGRARAFDLTGYEWIDVDSPEMFEKAEAHLKKKS